MSWQASSSGKESEQKTRRARIDPRLAAQGWGIAPFNATKPLAAYQNRAVAELPTDNGPADYALCRDGTILAIVEAKKVTLGTQNVLTQAERCACGATQNPLVYPEGFRVRANDATQAPRTPSRNGRAKR
jgi:type I restriction enzyme R subunit